MNVKLIRIEKNDRNVLEKLLDEYLGELSKHREAPYGATDSSSYTYLPLYWIENDRYPFLVSWEKRVVGFALIRRVFSEQQEVMQVAEFFIHPDNRRKGIGKAVVKELWRLYPGKWELQVHKRNLGAVEFWTSCIKKVASSSCIIDEVTHNDGRRLFFRFSIQSSETESSIA